MDGSRGPKDEGIALFLFFDCVFCVIPHPPYSHWRLAVTSHPFLVLMRLLCDHSINYHPVWWPHLPVGDDLLFMQIREYCHVAVSLSKFRFVVPDKNGGGGNRR